VSKKVIFKYLFLNK